MDEKNGLPILPFASQRDWETWLAKHHPTSKGLWLKIAKKASGIDSVTYAEALDVALCYGWIDGQKGAFDDTFWLQRFTPRGSRSKWSKINVDKALALIEAGRMQAGGPGGGRGGPERRPLGAGVRVRRARHRARRTCSASWTRTPTAAKFFATLNSANRYAVLYRVHEAKKPETRARRIEKFIDMLNRHEKVHP